MTTTTDKWGFNETTTAKSDLRGEIEEIDADLIGMVEELREVRERIAEAKKERAALVALYKALKR